MSRGRRVKERKSMKKLAYGVIVVILILLGFLTYFSLQRSNQPPQVAIVDHLDFTGQSNPTFVNACINILDKGGLTWKYYRGEDVTVDFYRNLPSYGTALIILRQHSAIMRENGETVPLLGLFTSERYYGPIDAAKKYPKDVEDGRLVRAFFTDGGEEEYFGIVPKFVEKSMKGRFEDTIIIMMGCQGLGYDGVTYTDMAEAFIDKGAKVFISWNGWVSVNHTDQATLDLLQSLVLEKQTIKKAVEEVDSDPYYRSVLRFYPSGAANYTILNLRSSLTTNVVAYTSPTLKASKKSKYKAYE